MPASHGGGGIGELENGVLVCVEFDAIVADRERYDRAHEVLVKR